MQFCVKQNSIQSFNGVCSNKKRYFLNVSSAGEIAISIRMDPGFQISLVFRSDSRYKPVLHRSVTVGKLGIK